jgi:hypothetical protein
MWLRMTFDRIQRWFFFFLGMPWGFTIYCLTKSRWGLALHCPFLRAYISCKVLVTCAFSTGAASLCGNYRSQQELAELVSKISAKQQERKSFKLLLTRAASRASTFLGPLQCHSSSSARAPKNFKDYDAPYNKILFGT